MRRASAQDAAELARLLHDFNTEYEDYAPEVPVLTERIAEHIREDQATFFLAGGGPDGFSMVRFSSQLTSIPVPSHTRRRELDLVAGA